ncbi:hypothetical protein GCM10010174_09540 [Kutzneria viridogrisea]|uniref:Uncharacterized protein n=2 Tax=Kutzneria TaxID=43356 RepID=W5WLJ7_9PSEU|nr:hypothetical protein [Kutzneria albida]AHI01442.1 hypothetical protein KALB_8084 [Kutzneria albida DSM 43870]MBA8931406.1 fatty acid desaturase [Kutzneria viridogrisea]
MVEHPSAEEAARALRDVDRRRDQALGSLHGAKWVDLTFALVIFLCLASTDFLPSAAGWSGLTMAVLALGYGLLLRTRRGAAWLGHSARVDRSAIPPRFVLGVWLVFVAVCAAMFAVRPLHVQIPYGSTIMGAVLAIVLVVFGQHLRRGLAALVRRSRSGGAADGHA